VRRAVHRISGITRAVKVVRKEDLEFGERRKLLEEIELLKQLDHPNIGQVIEMYEDKKKIYFVNEMCHGGTLYERVTRDKHFNEIKAAHIIKQLLSAINYLHQSSIVHGDIQPKNIHFKD
jgi:calcium-dependent protein kinase